MEKKCERCGAYPKGMRLLDYCAVCSTDLCDNCMLEGCCGNVPAISGSQEDNGDIEPDDFAETELSNDELDEELE